MHVIEAGTVESFANGRIRHQDDIILILTDDVRAFGFQHPDDAKWNIADPHCLADRVERLKQSGDHRVSDHADFGSRPDLATREKSAVANRPITDTQVLRSDADHLAWLPIIITVDDLSSRTDYR